MSTRWCELLWPITGLLLLFCHSANGRGSLFLDKGRAQELLVKGAYMMCSLSWKCMVSIGWIYVIQEPGDRDGG